MGTITNHEDNHTAVHSQTFTKISNTDASETNHIQIEHKRTYIDYFQCKLFEINVNSFSKTTQTHLKINFTI